jgi:hypothetical protein
MKITFANLPEILEEHFNKIDEELVAVLKGHLLIEQLLNQIIEDFVFHEDKLIEARLGFQQKVHIAKSLSLSEQNNSMWNLVLAMNTLRNDFAHQLDSIKRAQKFLRTRGLYELEMKGEQFENVWNKGNVIGIAYTTSMIFGFLTSFHEEVLRFKELVTEMDKTMNKPT